MSIRDDILAGLRAAEADSVGDETPEELLERYDVLKRAEVLAEAAAAVAAFAGTPLDANAKMLRRMAAEAGESRG